jgi:hypothetical protein
LFFSGAAEQSATEVNKSAAALLKNKMRKGRIDYKHGTPPGF